MIVPIAFRPRLCYLEMCPFAVCPLPRLAVGTYLESVSVSRLTAASFPLCPLPQAVQHRAAGAERQHQFPAAGAGRRPGVLHPTDGGAHRAQRLYPAARPDLRDGAHDDLPAVVRQPLQPDQLDP